MAASGDVFAHAGEQAQLDAVGPPVLGHWRHGKPRRIRTDNEIIFTSWVFTTFLKLVGIRHQRIQTCAPWQNGRIERLFGTPAVVAAIGHSDKGGAAIRAGRVRAVLQPCAPTSEPGWLTPAEKWNGLSKVDVLQRPPKRAVLVQSA